MKRIEVAVGVIFNSNHEVLVAQRTVADQYFQKWEFPGGKLEANETPRQALDRELYEELGIEVLQSEDLPVVEFDYPDRQVRLYVQKVTEYKGEPAGAEGQALKWISLEFLLELDLLDSVQLIIDLLETELHI